MGTEMCDCSCNYCGLGLGNQATQILVARIEASKQPPTNHRRPPPTTCYPFVRHIQLPHIPLCRGLPLRRSLSRKPDPCRATRCPKRRPLPHPRFPRSSPPSLQPQSSPLHSDTGSESAIPCFRPVAHDDTADGHRLASAQTAALLKHPLRRKSTLLSPSTRRSTTARRSVKWWSPLLYRIY